MFVLVFIEVCKYNNLGKNSQAQTTDDKKLRIESGLGGLQESVYDNSFKSQHDLNIWPALFDFLPLTLPFYHKPLIIQQGINVQERLLNKPYANEVTFRGQKPPLKSC